MADPEGFSFFLSTFHFLVFHLSHDFPFVSRRFLPAGVLSPLIFILVFHLSHDFLFISCRFLLPEGFFFFSLFSFNFHFY